MVFTRKFSQFPNGGPQTTGDQPVGLEAGVNTIWEFAGGGGGSGNVIFTITQDTSALMVGRWVRFDLTTNLYVHGIATTAEFAEIEGVVLSILGPNQFMLQQAGYIASGTPGFAGFTPGIYYLSDTILGQQALTVPTTNGFVNKPLFAADSPDSGWVICLMRGMIIGTPGPIPAPGPPGGTDTSIHQVSQPGNTFAIGDWVTVSGDNTYALSDSTTLAGAQGVGVVIAAGNPLFTIQFSGWNSNTVIGAVDGVGTPIAIVASTAYYISNVVPGAITPNPPTAIGTANKPAFISASTMDGTGWVLPQRPILNTTSDINPEIIVVHQVAHGLTRGQVVRISALNTYVTAQADTAVHALPVGFVRQVIGPDDFVLQTQGYSDQFGAPFPALTPSIRYFLSATIAGAITNVEPMSPNYSVPMLIALNPTTGYILSQRPLINSAGGIIPLSQGGTQTNLTAPGADSLFAWNFALNHAEFLGIGTGLAIVGTNLTATGGGGGGNVLISSQNIVNGSTIIDFPGVLNGTFQDIQIVGEDIVLQQVPGGQFFGQNIAFRIYTSGVLRTAGYYKGREGFSTSQPSLTFFRFYDNPPGNVILWTDGRNFNFKINSYAVDRTNNAKVFWCELSCGIDPASDSTFMTQSPSPLGFLSSTPGTTDSNLRVMPNYRGDFNPMTGFQVFTNDPTTVFRSGTISIYGTQT